MLSTMLWVVLSSYKAHSHAINISCVLGGLCIYIKYVEWTKKNQLESEQQFLDQ